jgi:hypothetical protein
MPCFPETVPSRCTTDNGLKHFSKPRSHSPVPCISERHIICLCVIKCTFTSLSVKCAQSVVIHIHYNIYTYLGLYSQKYNNFTCMFFRLTNKKRRRRRLVVLSVVFSTIAVLSMLFKVLAEGGVRMQTHK